ncbi:hypothetical protein EMIT0P253_360047 [Pseudomonas sp. IT-P253]
MKKPPLSGGFFIGLTPIWGVYRIAPPFNGRIALGGNSSRSLKSNAKSANPYQVEGF